MRLKYQLSGGKRVNWCFYICPFRYIATHIWACPPSEGDDYIFNCHPPDMKIPKQKRLQDWYKKMLDKAIIERVVVDYKVIATDANCFQKLLWLYLLTM